MISELNKEMALVVAHEYCEVGESLASEKLGKFEAEMRRLETEKQSRVDKVAFLVASISQLWTELHITKEQRTSALDLQITSNEHGKLGITAAAMALVQARFDDLQAEKLRRLTEIDAYSKKILPLWDRLEVCVRASVRVCVDVWMCA